jgi:uncharacterized membrane protein YfcA
MGAYAGGASLISIPFLIFMGIPPEIAIATNRVAQTGLTLSIVLRFLRSGKILWTFVPVLSILAVLGGVIGAQTVTVLDPKILPRIIGIIILAFLPVLLMQKKLAVENTVATHKKWQLLLGSLLYFLIMIFGGFFGGGAMIMMAIVTTTFFGFSILQANATNNVPWLLLCLSAVCVFISKGLVDWPLALVLLAGTSLGGYLGAHLALKQGDKLVKKIFIAISALSGLVLILK